MKIKKLLPIILASTMTIAATFSGCSYITSNGNQDLSQVVATVDISKAEDFAEDETDLAVYAPVVGETKIYKSELISYFINVGYSYVNSGMTYYDTFTSLMDSIVQNAVAVQYAKMYLLNYKAETEYNGSSDAVISAYISFETEVEQLEWLLSSEDINVAKYNLMASINSSLDSYELQLLESSDSNSGTDTLTTPGNVDTEVEDYYPKNADDSLNYNVYTGYSSSDYDYTLANSGEYAEDRVDTFKGYTPENSKTRRANAYNNFISTLISNGLVDAETENVRDVMSLQYVQDQYIAQLEDRILQKYYDLYEEEQEATLSANDYAYLQEIYEDLYSSQSETYDDTDTFTDALSNMSDTSFILYSPNTSSSSDSYEGDFGGTYGFIYNILLPYSEAQSVKLAEYQADYTDQTVSSSSSDDDDDTTTETRYTVDYYNARNQLLKAITTTDQRDVWFNGSTDYSFDASTSGLNFYSKNSNYLFFENNLLNTERYETLERYAGLYAFNGTVSENSDGTYTIIKNKLTIDDMLSEFSDYVDYVLGGSYVTFDNGYVKGYENAAYYNELDNYDLYKNYDGGENTSQYEIDYSNFVYASGKVNVGDDDLSTKHTNTTYNSSYNVLYQAMSAVNELQYAYTTDTGVLSNYLGYAVSLYDTTGYIKEFEYAAHQALAGGAGTFVVCAGDYGWHLIYVTYTFDVDGGAVYEPDWVNNIDKEGTFENLFYEWVKSSAVEDASSTRNSWIVTKYSIEDTTYVLYEDRYQNLLDLDEE